MTVNVVTVFAPRKSREHWRDDYRELLALQRQTALKFGHRHFVVTDRPDYLPGLDLLEVELPQNLMRAQLAGQIAWLQTCYTTTTPTVLVDADVLIARDLSLAFADAPFDLGLTPRAHPTAPVNNGAMYVQAGAAAAVLPFFRHALEICAEDWGADQDAISAAAAPVGEPGTFAERHGARVAFLSMRIYNVSPKVEGARHAANPFVVHFKGETKPWAATYARKWIL